MNSWMDIQEVLAENLRRLRHQRDMTQEDLAAAAGVERGYISRLENCRKEAGLRILPKLANALGVEPADLITPLRRSSRR